MYERRPPTTRSLTLHPSRALANRQNKQLQVENRRLRRRRRATPQRQESTLRVMAAAAASFRLKMSTEEHIDKILRDRTKHLVVFFCKFSKEKFLGLFTFIPHSDRSLFFSLAKMNTRFMISAR